LGATEQKFNLLMGRELQRLNDQPPQLIMTLPVLPGLDGVQRMSKSLGNYIGVTDPPREMFGKVMSLPDQVMETFWQLATDASEEELSAVRRDLNDSRVNPMVVKKQLGERLVALYHDRDAAAHARADFEAQFSRKEVPENLEVFEADEASGFPARPTIVNFAMASGMCGSRSEVRRLLDAGAIEIDGERIRGVETLVRPELEHILRIGRRMKRYLPPARAKQVR
jgi:tyrosyl-tRNA synthetase